MSVTAISVQVARQTGPFSSFGFYDSNPAFCSPHCVFPDTNLDLASFAPDPSLSLYDTDPSAFVPLAPDLASFGDLDYASLPTGTSSSPYAPDSYDLTAISTPAVDVNDSAPFLDIDSSGTDSDTNINRGQVQPLTPPLLMPASRPPPVSITAASTSKNHPPKETTNKVSKRQLNTLAARRYRQRRVDRMNELEAELEKVKRERDELKMRVSKLEGETEALRGLLRKDK
ncbi:bZIP transcription factor JlbA/IDI-4 [Aspergillus novofumigatus IBT 16806]|uniref:BZIP transcription factor JlbA/IDI-4 n=1 Tax=Aspergillus novofumigatus (strain IBT 16806) TaxID=1392255 RepID=A0A2I1CFP9_ASPN1|nr:bZIP transcription factor JlbA/IDI-4 [Aspergillus novofumigatus IBT 16806]PKX96444.1 bZIP transcription factor JlbA/IDI-4 [Aspergillus novofumigatus IBT 16806]